MGERKIEIKRRHPGVRKPKPVLLIITEGKNKTETLYFSHFQEQGRDYSVKFIKAGTKTDAQSLYEKVLGKWDELELSIENGDRCFIVLDIDNDSRKADKVIELIRKNNNDAIQFVVSNPTFEIWYLLHFEYTTKRFADGRAVIKELIKHLPQYEKNIDVYNVLEDKQSVAIENAGKLEKYFADNKWPSTDCNPRTDVSWFVDMLQGWVR